MDIVKQENRKDDFVSKRGTNQVPVMELPSGANISESMAICRYFEALVPEPALFGDASDAQDVAIVEMMNRIVGTS